MRFWKIFIFALFAISLSAHATDYTWTGTSSNIWSNRWNWTNRQYMSGEGSYDDTYTFNSSISRNISIGYPIARIRAKTLTFDQNCAAQSFQGRMIYLENGGIFQNSTANQTFNTYVVLHGNNTVDVQGNASLIANWTMGHGNAGEITKTGTGTWALNGTGGNARDKRVILTEGTLQVGQQNSIVEATSLVFNGGTFDSNGYSQLIKNIELTSTSTLNFTNPVNSTSTVRSNTTSNWDSSSILQVTGWDGGQYGGGQHQLYLGSGANQINAQQLSQIKFVDPGTQIGTYDAMMMVNGEIVPVPEPATVALGSALLGLVGADARRRKLAAKKDNQG